MRGIGSKVKPRPLGVDSFIYANKIIGDSIIYVRGTEKEEEAIEFT